MSVLGRSWAPSSKRAAASTPFERSRDRSPARVLIADADPVSRHALEDMLRHLGHPCDCAEDGEQAYERYLTFRPDVVIVESTMPGLDVRELCRRIHESSHGRYCHVISIAAHGGCDTARAGGRLGADDYITKPLRSSQLESRLAAAGPATAFPSKLPVRDAELVGVARRDPLTGLGNRLALSEDLAALDARTRRYGHSYCIASCELDRREATDVPHEQLSRDHWLMAAAQAFREECHGADFAYRAGGEEIVVVLPGRTLRAAGVVLERIRRAVQVLAIPESRAGSTRVATLSAGMATRESSPVESCREVLARARAALAEAAARGPDHVVVGTGSLTRASNGIRASRALVPGVSASEQDRALFAPGHRTAEAPAEGPKPATTSPVVPCNSRSPA